MLTVMTGYPEIELRVDLNAADGHGPAERAVRFIKYYRNFLSRTASDPSAVRLERQFDLYISSHHYVSVEDSKLLRLALLASTAPVHDGEIAN